MTFFADDTYTFIRRLIPLSTALPADELLRARFVVGASLENQYFLVSGIPIPIIILIALFVH